MKEQPSAAGAFVSPGAWLSPRVVCGGAVVLCCALFLTNALSAESSYSRQATTAPQAEDIGGGYEVPPVQRTPPRSDWWYAADIVLLLGGLLLVAVVNHRWRRRWVITAVTVASVAYFGFYRQGCVCPVGATQNVATSISDASYAVPLAVLLFFLLPLAAALLVGRVFCGGVCPLGAIQELVLLRPVQVPRKIDRWAGSIKYVYLAAAVWFAVLPAATRDYVICRYDPFVGFFRLNGPALILALGAGLLLLGTVVGRPYCRYLCPYGGLLALVSRFAVRPVRITPDEELDCGLCVDSCPYGAIENLRAVPSKCLACTRCFAHCPRQQLAWGQIELIDIDNLMPNPPAAKQPAKVVP